MELQYRDLLENSYFFYLQKFLYNCHRLISERNLQSPTCFVSYCWGPEGPEREQLQSQLSHLKEHLKMLNVTVLLDIQNLRNDINLYMRTILDCDFVFLIGTPALRARFEENIENNLKREFNYIQQKAANDGNWNFLFALIFQGEGEFDSALWHKTLPIFVDLEPNDQNLPRVMIRDCRRVGNNPRKYIEALSGLDRINQGIVSILFQFNQHNNDFHFYRDSLIRELGTLPQSQVIGNMQRLELELKCFNNRRDRETDQYNIDQEETGITCRGEYFVNLILRDQKTIEEERIRRNEYFQAGDDMFIDLEQGQNRVDANFDNTMHSEMYSQSFYPNNEPRDLREETNLLGMKDIGTFLDSHNEIMILGVPGSGKTTLCQCLANQVNEDFHGIRFKFVFLIHLKEIATFSNDVRDIHKILHLAVLHNFIATERDSEKLWKELLNNHSEDILFILDGYDEIIPLPLHVACKKLLSIRDTNPLDGTGACYKNIHLIVTSRPYVYVQRKYGLVLENIGFIEKDINPYVQRYLTIHKEELNEEQSLPSIITGLQKFLAVRPKIRKICKIPIYLKLLCSIWLERESDIIKGDLVISDLYDYLLVEVMTKFLKDRAGLTGAEWDSIAGNRQSIMKYAKAVSALNYFECLAFKSFENGSLIINQDLFNSVREEFDSLFLKVGFLKSVGTINKQEEGASVKSYCFSHLSVQEYFCACFIAKTLQKEGSRDQTNARDQCIRFIQRNKFNPRYFSIWLYVAGILARHGNSARLLGYYFNNILLSGPKDLFGVSELMLLVRCYEETKWPDIPLTREIMQYLTNTIYSLYKSPKDEIQNGFARVWNRLLFSCPILFAKLMNTSEHNFLDLLAKETKPMIYPISMIVPTLISAAYFVGKIAASSPNSLLPMRMVYFVAILIYWFHPYLIQLYNKYENPASKEISKRVFSAFSINDIHIAYTLSNNICITFQKDEEQCFRLLRSLTQFQEINKGVQQLLSLPCQLIIFADEVKLKSQIQAFYLFSKCSDHELVHERMVFVLNCILFHYYRKSIFFLSGEDLIDTFINDYVPCAIQAIFRDIKKFLQANNLQNIEELLKQNRATAVKFHFPFILFKSLSSDNAVLKNKIFLLIFWESSHINRQVIKDCYSQIIGLLTIDVNVFADETTRTRRRIDDLWQRNEEPDILKQLMMSCSIYLRCCGRSNMFCDPGDINNMSADHWNKWIEDQSNREKWIRTMIFCAESLCIERCILSICAPFLFTSLLWFTIILTIILAIKPDLVEGERSQLFIDIVVFVSIFDAFCYSHNLYSMFLTNNRITSENLLQRTCSSSFVRWIYNILACVLKNCLRTLCAFEISSSSFYLPRIIWERYSKLDAFEKILFRNDHFFDSFLRNYPNMNIFNADNVLPEILRKHFTNFSTAVWFVKEENMYYWYKGEELIKFQVTSRRFSSDLEKSRLFPVFQSKKQCWGSCCFWNSYKQSNSENKPMLHSISEISRKTETLKKEVDALLNKQLEQSLQDFQ